MLRAVLFDWGGTLVAGGYDEKLAAAGRAAGLAAVGPVASLPTGGALGRRFRDAYLPQLLAPREDELDYVAVVRALFRDEGCVLDDAAVWRFVAAEHDAWRSVHQLVPGALDLLRALRARGLATGIVSNAFDPGVLVRGELERLGVSALCDVVVLSSETGKRKPHPAGFRLALDALGIEPAEALFVGDRVREDVDGAAAVGMRTAHAVWFLDGSPGEPRAERVVATPAELVAFVDVLRTA
jgi:putative hydrolase of the HAD superfamily